MSSLMDVDSNLSRQEHAPVPSSLPASVHSVERLRAEFHRRYGSIPAIFRAPGRVNLIGEHTDYNDGFVMPVAISLGTMAAIAPRADGRKALRVASLDLEGAVEQSLDELTATGNWSDYVIGVAAQLLRQGVDLPGADLLVSSQLPLGGGLSSSAALECSAALALTSLCAFPVLSRERLARCGQAAEHEFVGTQCGIMDQMISLLGRRSHALLIDCRSMEWEAVRLPQQVMMAICNTGVRHELASSAYNERRQQCREAVRLLQARHPHVKSLRDLSPEELHQWEHELPGDLRRRARHVVEENQRVLSTRFALAANHLNDLRMLLDESHRSLRDDFQVSCRELDLMVEAAQNAPGFLAGRMTGGGFGGCTVNLIDPSQADRFADAVLTRYRRRFDTAAEIYLVESSDGAHQMQ